MSQGPLAARREVLLAMVMEAEVMVAVRRVVEATVQVAVVAAVIVMVARVAEAVGAVEVMTAARVADPHSGSAHL